MKNGMYIWLSRFFGIAGIGLGLVLSVEPDLPISISIILAAVGGFLLGKTT